MECYVYASLKKDGAYIYLKDPKDFDSIPQELKDSFGKARFMLKFDLFPERKIARVKAQDVISALEKQGYFLRIDSTNEEDNYLNKDRKIVV